MKTMRTLKVVIAAGLFIGLASGLVACGGGGNSERGSAPAASTEFNSFVLTNMAGGEALEPTEVNDLVFEYADDDDAAFGAVVDQ